jgi:hypothetical protein
MASLLLYAPDFIVCQADAASRQMPNDDCRAEFANTDIGTFTEDQASPSLMK